MIEWGGGGGPGGGGGVVTECISVYSCSGRVMTL